MLILLGGLALGLLIFSVVEGGAAWSRRRRGVTPVVWSARKLRRQARRAPPEES